MNIKIMKKLFFLMLPALLAGCATLGPGDIPAQSEWESPEPFTLEMGADVFQLRLDLVREKQTAVASTITISDGSYKRRDEFVPYHYLGTYIGNGLFLDINGNITVDIIRLLGFDSVYGFRLHRTERGALDAPAEMSREGAKITIDEGNWGSDAIVAEMSGDGFTVKTSSFFSPDKIEDSGDRIDFIPSGLFSEFRTASIVQDDAVTRGSTSYRVEQLDENTLSLNNLYRIIREDDRILLKGRGGTLLMTIVKSGDRYVYFRSDSYGSWIEKLPGVIRISDNGSITEYTYEVDAQPFKQQSPRRQDAEEDQRSSRAKAGRVKTEKRVERNTRRDASSSLPPN
ncbi:MAG: hypothetical protein LBQ57_08670 [Spirochaetales bacterium]|jgi:hypothetical protein|nr:hypothetical protein [Spirochaetales bacterium]